VLTANFRNGLEATRVANQLLKIKHRRFGSIDRESNFLVQAVGGEPGQVALMPDKDARSANSTRRFASPPSSPCWSCATRTRPKREALRDAAAVLDPRSQGARVREHRPLPLHLRPPRRVQRDRRRRRPGRPRRRHARLPAGQGQERQVARGLQVLRQCPLRGADARHPERLRHRVGHRPSAVRPARHESRPGEGRRPAIDSRRLAEGSAQARTAGQAGAGRSHPPDDPQADAGSLAGVRRSQGLRAAGQGLPRTASRRQAQAAALRIRHLPR
jgi:hypothetical protein